MSTRIISPIGRVLTSLVPPVHNQGVSPAPLQGLALWKIFLLTTGSFFVFLLLTFFRQQHFSVDVFLLHSDFYTSSFRRWFQPSSTFYSNAQTSPGILFSVCFTPPLRFPVLRYHSASSDHHNRLLLSGSCRRSGSACMRSLSRTASSLKDSVSVSCNSYGFP